MTVDPAVLKVADAVGALTESWGFKRNMGRMWAVLYLEDHPLNAGELSDRLGLSTGSVSMLLTEMQGWGVVKKTWVVGERREHYEAETSIWKMVSRVFRERELQWIRTAHDAFASALAMQAGDERSEASGGGNPGGKAGASSRGIGERSESGGENPTGSARRVGPRGIDERAALITRRIEGLAQLAQVGAHLLESMLQGESVDSLPIKTVGDLAKAAGEREP